MSEAESNNMSPFGMLISLLLLTFAIGFEGKISKKKKRQVGISHMVDDEDDVFNVEDEFEVGIKYQL